MAIENVDWHDVLDAYLLGMGGSFHFQDGDYFAEQIRKDPYLQNIILKEIAKEIAGGKSSSSAGKSYYGEGGVEQGAKDANPRNMEVFEVGSYNVKWRKVGPSPSGGTRVALHITNWLSNESIAHYAQFAGDSSYRAATKIMEHANPVPNVGTDISITVTVP